MTPPYYAGTTLAMMCDVIPQVPLEQTGSVDILRDGSPVSEAVKTSSSTGVQSTLTLSPLSMTANSGAYVCVGRSSPNPPNNNILNSNDFASTITIQVSGLLYTCEVSITVLKLQNNHTSLFCSVPFYKSYKPVNSFCTLCSPCIACDININTCMCGSQYRHSSTVMLY